MGHLMGVTEIGKMLGVSRQRADQLSQTDGFPKPTAELASGRVWNQEDIEAWAKATGRVDR
jgi:predicted DNA-binding transcriptional regulator AlpA